MSRLAAKLATYADLASVAEGVRAEIISGILESQPAPFPRHSKAQGALRRFIGGPYDDDDGFGGPGGWWVFVEVDVELSAHDVVHPDLSGWRRERLDHPDQRPISTRPDWVCEILSPSTASRDRVAKRRLYAAHEIPYYWIVDPETRTLEALALRDEGWFEVGIFGESDVVRIAPFDRIELSIDRLFLPKR